MLQEYILCTVRTSGIMCVKAVENSTPPPKQSMIEVTVLLILLYLPILGPIHIGTMPRKSEPKNRMDMAKTLVAVRSILNGS